MFSQLCNMSNIANGYNVWFLPVIACYYNDNDFYHTDIGSVSVSFLFRVVTTMQQMPTATSDFFQLAIAWYYDDNDLDIWK